MNPPHSVRPFLAGLLCALALLGATARGSAASTATKWRSLALDADVPVEILAPTAAEKSAAATPQPAILYLRGLAAPRLGTEPDADIIADFRAQGYLVISLDFGGDPRARWPHLNHDLAALRAQIHRREFLADHPLDRAQIYIVPAGHRLARDIEFGRDGPRRLALDIIYPARPAQPVGALIEFSCDNADRMGNYSLQYCTDTLLEGAATEGFIVAMADHPVPAPYKGLDAMPHCAERIKAAVRTLRHASRALGGNGSIVPVGFSRGSGMALLLATTNGRDEFETYGAHRDVSSDVQGAVVLSGRFTYLDLRPDDTMIPRYTAAWGPRETSLDRWRAHGALDHLRGPTVPLFLSINATESPDALHQMEVLRRRLSACSSPFVYHPETAPRGHRVPLAEAVLTPMLDYLRRQLHRDVSGDLGQSSPPR